MKEVEEDIRSRDFKKPKHRRPQNKEPVVCRRHHPNVQFQKKKLEKSATAVKEHSESYKLQLHVKKTKVIKTDKSGEACHVKIDDETLETVYKCEYLGSAITINKDGTIEIIT